ncbi:MAG: CoA-binding protein [Syntrophus sp. (in: bacteria)]|nr:CoA-binding protein [Syntrophus sp. (in: bacteria)]
MQPSDIINKAKSAGHVALTEAESKQLLKYYGVPVIEEWVVKTEAEAVRQAKATGFPVVLKGLGTRLTHKTERGLVKVNLRNLTEVRRAARQIIRAAGPDLEGLLVQPMLNGKREFVAGFFNDAQFGPVVMFGLGGVFTEALDDVVFRVAPLDEVQAGRMLDELRSVELLGSFRGEQPANRRQLVQALVGLSRLSVELTDVTEVDINPLLVGADGQVTAVDALVILGERPVAKEVRPPIDPHAIGNLFYPRSVAFVGVSAEFGKWGHSLFSILTAGNYKGSIYLVNPKGAEIAGRPVYKTVMDIPGVVDLAVVTIPAAGVRALIPELQAKGVKNMLLITSGFSETGEQGRQMEEDLVREARAAGILVLGPNTMGICNPHYSFYCTGTHTWPKPGSIALVAQSGNLGTQLLVFAESEDIGIRAFSGSGNEAMITIEDYLDGFEIDELTRTVVLYIESVKNGRRFLESARRVGRKKPVIVLKGGRTEAGNRAAASHTGALASNIRIFDAACRQAGIVLVEQPLELLDLSAAFSSLPLPKGNRVGIITLGGGWGVVASDLCAERGLELPELEPDMIARIDRILPPYWSRSNPVDLVAEMNPQVAMTITEELLQWDRCDAVIHLGILGRMVFVGPLIRSALTADPTMNRALLEDIPSLLRRFEDEYIRFILQLMEKYGKPIIGVSLMGDEQTRTVVEIEGSPYKSVAFLTPERSVKVLAKMVGYQRWLQGEGAMK